MTEQAAEQSVEPVPCRNTSWVDFVPAALVAAWNVASAPFLTKYVVEPIREALGADQFVTVLASAVGVLGVAVVIAGALHLRQARLLRIGLILSGLALVAIYVVASDRGQASVAMVEHLHFVTYGSLAALLIVPLRSLRAMAPVGGFAVLLLVALLDEGLQWFVPVRTGEMFDIGLNLYAGIVGSLVGMGLFSVPEVGVGANRRGFALGIGWRPERWEKLRSLPTCGQAAQTLGPLSGLVVFLAAGFVQAVHLGHEISDPNVGTFRSFFTEEQLAERNRRATIAWSERPPGELTPFEKEDWFRTEAGWHVSARNVAQSQEVWGVADRENAILVNYYSAFLPLVGSDGKPYALNEFDTAAIARFAGASADPADFYGSADSGRIWLRPSRAVLWSSAAVVGGLLFCWPAWTRRSGSQSTQSS